MLSIDSRTKIFPSFFLNMKLNLLKRIYVIVFQVHTLNYLIHKNQKSDKETLKAILNKAKKVREEAQLIVRKQEENYRYPYDIIAVKRKNKTAYRYGYLYTVSDLYFWEREELQAKKNKYNAWYKKINSFLRISGVIN